MPAFVRQLRRLLTWLAPWVCLVAWAGPEITLFQKSGEPVPSFNTLMAGSQVRTPGTILVMGDGVRFEVMGALGSGKTCTILKVRPLNDARMPQEVALRLPQTSAMTPYINETTKGYAPLRKAGMPVPKIYRATKSQYVASEYIPLAPGDFSAQTLFTSPEKITNSQAREEAWEALKKVAPRFAEFEQVGDFLPDQLVYRVAERKWYLLDWTNQHRGLFTQSYENTAFGNQFEIGLVLTEENGELGTREITSREWEMLHELREIVFVRRQDLRLPACLFKWVLRH